MKSNLKKCIVMMLSLMMIVSCFRIGTFSVLADEVSEVTFEEETNELQEDEENLGRTKIDGGSNGGVTWKFYDDGFLDVTVTGDMVHKPGHDPETGKFYYWPWANHLTKITSAEVTGGGMKYANYMFYNCDSLVKVDFSNFDTSTVENISCMFLGCLSLKEFDCRDLNVENVTDMSGMFGMSSVEKVNMSGMNFKSLKSMGYMFENCNKLENVDLTGVNTSKVDTFCGMFSGCTSIKSIDLSSLDTGNNVSMVKMFENCVSLESVNLSGFDTKLVMGMSEMFINCKSLKSVDMSSFDLSGLVIDFGNYPTENVFKGCDSLQTIKTPKVIQEEEDFSLELPAIFINENGEYRGFMIDENDTYYRWKEPVNDVKLDKASVNMDVGSTVKLKASVIPSNATLKTLRWKSSNPKIATVDSKGNVKGISAGNATITVITVDGSRKAYCKVTVEDKPVEMYRLYNPNSGEHFYTGNRAEINKIVDAGWKNEGVAWKAPKKSKTPVYRLYNPNAGDHHYTMSRSEKENLIKAGWKDEGIGWYSDDAKGVALQRLYNPNAKAGSHHYTTSIAEKDNLVKVGWKYEGLAWYGMK